MIDYMYTGGYEELPSADFDRSSEQGSDKLYSTSPMVLHARMASLADMYLVDGLRHLSEAKFKEAVHQETDTLVLLGAISEVYSLQFGSCRIFRDIIIGSIRERTAQPPFDVDIKGQLEGVIAEVPDFAIDLLKSYIYQPVLGRCHMCGRDQLVSVEPLQCRCKRCGKGGASALPKWWEKRYDEW